MGGLWRSSLWRKFTSELNDCSNTDFLCFCNGWITFWTSFLFCSLTCSSLFRFSICSLIAICVLSSCSSSKDGSGKCSGVGGEMVVGANCCREISRHNSVKDDGPPIFTWLGGVGPCSSMVLWFRMWLERKHSSGRESMKFSMTGSMLVFVFMVGFFVANLKLRSFTSLRLTCGQGRRGIRTCQLFHLNFDSYWNCSE